MSYETVREGYQNEAAWTPAEAGDYAEKRTAKTIVRLMRKPVAVKTPGHTCLQYRFKELPTVGACRIDAESFKAWWNTRTLQGPKA